MNDEFISIAGFLKAATAGPSSTLINQDQASHLVTQLAADATSGTYVELLPNLWKGKYDLEPRRQARIDEVRSFRDGYSFKIAINTKLFDPVRGGMQHLFGILAGDLLDLRVAGFDIQELTVQEVVFPESWRTLMRGAFRGTRAHTIDEIRSLFGLKVGEPLLAFSVKPRVGLSFETLSDLTLDVLRAGFHLVELDTRNLPTDPATLDKFVELAEKAAGIGASKRITRFSINLSASSPHVLETVRKLVQKCGDGVVVKVDGGLDGLSTIQSIRSEFAAHAPVITTYPLFRKLLSPKVGQDMFTDALYLSGSDILYPGGAPSLGGAYRELDHVAKDALSLGVSRYQKIVQKREPMPTIAGGVHPGELQALYELLGPDVGYFLGGAVALHSGGPKQGAELCVAIINASIKLRNEAKENEFSKALDDKLIRKIQDSYPLPPAATNETLAYLSPQIFAGKSLRPWSSH